MMENNKEKNRKKKVCIKSVSTRNLKIATYTVKKHIPNIATSALVVALYISGSGLSNPFSSVASVHPHTTKSYTENKVSYIEEYYISDGNIKTFNEKDEIIFKSNWSETDEGTFKRKICVYETDNAEKFTKDFHIYNMTRQELTKLFGTPKKELEEFQSKLTEADVKSLENVEIILHFVDKNKSKEIKLSYKQRAKSFLILMLLLVFINGLTDYMWLLLKAPKSLKEKIIELNEEYNIDAKKTRNR